MKYIYLFVATIMVVLVLIGCSDWDVDCHDGIYTSTNKPLVVKSVKYRIPEKSTNWYVIKDASTTDAGFDLYTDQIFKIGDTIKLVKQ